MAITYTAWPTPAQVYSLLSGANISPTMSVSNDLVQVFIDEVVSVLTMKTQRQFLAGSSGETRDFDGSGTGLLVIDDYVDVTDVSVSFLPTASTVSIAGYVEVDQKPWGKNKLQIYKGQAFGAYGFYQTFPEGRSNITVTATWGYGSTIKPDVWAAVLKRAAGCIADANSLTVQGAIAAIQEADVGEKYASGLVSDTAGWNTAFREVLKTYKKPLKQHLVKSSKRLY